MADPQEPNWRELLVKYFLYTWSWALNEEEARFLEEYIEPEAEALYHALRKKSIEGT